MATAKKKTDEPIQIQAIEPITIKVTVQALEGKSDLHTHRFGETALKGLRDSTMKKPRQGKKAKRDPDQEYKESLYVFGKDTIGVPAIMFKKAMTNACRLTDLPMTHAKQMIFVLGTDPDEPEFCEVYNTAPQIHEAIVPAGNGKGATLSYRACFPGDWRIDVGLQFIPNVISTEQVLNLLNLAGFSVGIGCQRPERGGQYGRFSIVANGTA
jgi:hypothetical protein|tara:strand:+ start:2335 stop:2970 length:636 start_codon:yes stop_codon:yes gene_type:complete